MATFFKGQLFTSFHDVKIHLENYMKDNNVRFCIRSCKKIGHYKKKFLKHPINAQLVYYDIKFICVRGGEFRPRKHINKLHNTIKLGCPAHVSLRASKCGTCLVVTSHKSDHNHSTNNDPSIVTLEDDLNLVDVVFQHNEQSSVEAFNNEASVAAQTIEAVHSFCTKSFDTENQAQKTNDDDLSFSGMTTLVQVVDSVMNSNGDVQSVENPNCADISGQNSNCTVALLQNSKSSNHTAPSVRNSKNSKKTVKISSAIEEDADDAFGQYVALTLRTIGDPVRKEVARMKIIEVMIQQKFPEVICE